MSNLMTSTSTAEFCLESLLFLYNFYIYSLILSALLFESAFGILRHSPCIPQNEKEKDKKVVRYPQTTFEYFSVYYCLVSVVLCIKKKINI